jgi:hypothetical protein
MPAYLGMPFSGNVFWVDSNAGSDSGAGSFDTPYDTVDYAIGKCTASNGDVIFVKEGHTETLTAASAITCDVAGVTIIGLGEGSLRPTFTFTTANTATIVVSAANVKWGNCLFIGNFLSIATCFSVSAAGSDFIVDSCEFRDTSAILGFLTIVTTAATTSANGLTIKNCRRNSAATTTPGPLVSALGAMARLSITDNLLVHSVDGATLPVVLSHGALVLTDVFIARNRIYCVHADTSSGALLVKTSAITGSGLCCDNYIRSQDPAGAILVTATAVQYGMFNNLHTGETTLLSGFVLPAIGAD